VGKRIGNKASVRWQAKILSMQSDDAHVLFFQHGRITRSRLWDKGNEKGQRINYRA
jgi:hypothetical protein